MKLRTIGLALLASAFVTSTALAQTGTMKPIPNPPEKVKVKHKKHHHMAKKEASADAAKPADAKAAAPAKPAAPATPAKK